jgi:FkbM family methyltransferase
MNDLKTRLGLLRSELIYLWKPFNRYRLRRFYREFVQPAALCFDIGAHLGSRSQALLDLGGRIVAVEPQPHCAAYLDRRLGGRPGFTLCAMAAGAAPGRATLHLNRLNPAISTLAPAAWRRAMASAARGRERWDRTLAIEVTTLDRLIAEFGLPGFCKIDVEGFEEEVLRGLSRPIPLLSFEFISFEPQRASACLRRLQALGPYRFNLSLRERQRLEQPDWIDARRLETILKAYTGEILSGDVYARLEG